MGRLLLTKTVVNSQKNLIGFIVKGKERDLGGFSEAMVERGFSVSDIIKTNFSNNQLGVANNKLIEKGKFRINSLPMCVYVGDSNPNMEYVDIDNTVNLVGRFVQENENIGFRVQFCDGSEENLKYENVIMLCRWYKPGNFSIRTSSKQNTYICGRKDGPRLEDLPAIVIGKEPEVKPKKMKSAAKPKEVKFNGAVESGFDILDIYGFIKDCNGSIIKLPSENYTAASEGGEKTDENFESLGIGEVASPVPMFNATKLNVNANFKKVGVVPVMIGGQSTNITTFVYRNKSIFLKGENYIKKFGIAVATEREEELLSKLGRSLALEKITDDSVIKPLSQVIDAKSLSFYTVDTSKIDLISADKRKASIMTGKQLATLCKKQYELNLLRKAISPKSGIMKELKEVMGSDTVASAKGKKKFGIFGMMNDEALKAVQAAGIDVYTGAYTSPSSTPYSKGSGASSDDAVEIEYSVKGYEVGKITGKQIIEAAMSGDDTKVPAGVTKYVKDLLDIADLKTRYLTAEKLYNKVEVQMADIAKKLWMHNASMYLNGNKSRIHVHDTKKWVPDTNTRVKTASVYVYTGADAEGLTVKFKGVSI